MGGDVQKIKQTIDLEKERYSQMQNEMIKTREVFEKSNVRLSNVALGILGEKAFYDVAFKAFRDMKCDITDCHNKGHSGDFHLSFENFTIMVDAKLYTNAVNITSRNKLKNDMKQKDDFTYLNSRDHIEISDLALASALQCLSFSIVAFNREPK